MTTFIDPAREAARQPNGRFGEQHRSASEVSLDGTDLVRSQKRAAALTAQRAYLEATLDHIEAQARAAGAAAVRFTSNPWNGNLEYSGLYADLDTAYGDGIGVPDGVDIDADISDFTYEQVIESERLEQNVALEEHFYLVVS